MGNRNHTPASDQARHVEIQRKLDIVLEWIQTKTQLRASTHTFGRLVVEMMWEDGRIKRVRLTDETQVEDLSEKDLERLIQDSIDTSSGENSAKRS